MTEKGVNNGETTVKDPIPRPRSIVGIDKNKKKTPKKKKKKEGKKQKKKTTTILPIIPILHVWEGSKGEGWRWGGGVQFPKIRSS